MVSSSHFFWPINGNMPPDPPPATTGETLQGTPPINSAPRNYLEAAAKPKVSPGPRLKPVPLASRPLAYVDSKPLVVFSQVEVEQLNKQRENTLIMKFSAGRAKLFEIRAYIVAEWELSSPPAIGLIDH